MMRKTFCFYNLPHYLGCKGSGRSAPASEGYAAAPGRTDETVVVELADDP